MQVIYSLDEELERVAAEERDSVAALQTKIFGLHEAVVAIECPRDDSLDNSVVVWMSQAFASVQGSGSTSSRVAGETSVPVVCTMLEDAGMTIGRCNNTEEAITKARCTFNQLLSVSVLVSPCLLCTFCTHRYCCCTGICN